MTRSKPERHKHSRFVGYFVLLALLFAAHPAGAAPAGLELRWSAPPGCPEERQVLATVEQLIGSRESTLREAISAEAVVEERDGAFHLTLSWRTQGSEAVRHVDGDTCLELAQAAALIVALAADPNARLALQAQADAAAGTNTSPAPAPPSAERPAVSKPPSERRSLAEGATAERASPRASESGRRLAFRATGALDLGSLPRPSPGGALGALLSLGPGALALEALSFLPTEGEVPGGGGRFWLSALSLRPCLVFEPSRLALLSCVAAEADLVWSRGQNVRRPDDGLTWFARFGLGIEAEYRLVPTLSVLVGGSLLLAPSRPRFVVDGSTLVHEPELVTGRLQLGFAYRP